jgi:hypothetical protein
MIKRARTRVRPTVKGWHFKHGNFFYWVGAYDPDSAMSFLSKMHAEAAKKNRSRFQLRLCGFSTLQMVRLSRVA